MTTYMVDTVSCSRPVPVTEFVEADSPQQVHDLLAQAGLTAVSEPEEIENLGHIDIREHYAVEYTADDRSHIAYKDIPL